MIAPHFVAEFSAVSVTKKGHAHVLSLVNSELRVDSFSAINRPHNTYFLNEPTNILVENHKMNLFHILSLYKFVYCSNSYSAMLSFTWMDFFYLYLEDITICYAEDLHFFL